jgi:hypothetical protein
MTVRGKRANRGQKGAQCMCVFLFCSYQLATKPNQPLQSTHRTSVPSPRAWKRLATLLLVLSVCFPRLVRAVGIIALRRTKGAVMLVASAHLRGRSNLGDGHRHDVADATAVPPATLRRQEPSVASRTGRRAATRLRKGSIEKNMYC